MQNQWLGFGDSGRWAHALTLFLVSMNYVLRAFDGFANNDEDILPRSSLSRMTALKAHLERSTGAPSPTGVHMPANGSLMSRGRKIERSAVWRALADAVSIRGYGSLTTRWSRRGIGCPGQWSTGSDVYPYIQRMISQSHEIYNPTMRTRWLWVSAM
jgi:hypothetical protein